MWENQEQLKLPLFREDTKLSCLRTGTSQLSLFLGANLDFFMWHFDHFWALWPVREALWAGTKFNCSLIILWLLQNSPVFRNYSFLGEKNKESPPLLSIYKKISSQLPLLLLLFWPDSNSANPIFSHSWELSRIPLGSLAFRFFFQDMDRFFFLFTSSERNLQLPPKFAFQVSLLIIQNVSADIKQLLLHPH